MRFDEQGAWFDKCKLEPIVFNPPVNRDSWVQRAMDKRKKEMAAEVRKMIHAGVKNSKDGGNKMDKQELLEKARKDMEYAAGINTIRQLYNTAWGIIDDIEELDEPKQRLSGKYWLLDNIIKHSVVTKHPPDKTVLEIHLDKLDYLFEHLEEPEKPVVPAFVAEWFEKNNDYIEGKLFSFIHSVYRKNQKGKTLNKMELWISDFENNPIETIIRMKDGYTVEEKKYQIRDKITNQYLGYDKVQQKPFWLIEQNSGAYAVLTEKEIRKIDPLLMAFAEEVD